MKIRDLMKAATPLPWHWDEGGGGLRDSCGTDVLEAYDRYVGIEIQGADKALITRAANSLPAVLEMLEEGNALLNFPNMRESEAYGMSSYQKQIAVVRKAIAKVQAALDGEAQE